MLSRPAHYNTRYKHDLTPKQVQVLRLMAKGKTNAEIGEALGLTLDGAKWHVSEILGKLGTDSREDAVAWWNAYRRPSARAARRMTAVLGWGLWKPAAIGAAGLTVVAVAGLGFLTFRGGGSVEAFDDLPGCELEDMRAETAVEPAGEAVRLTYFVKLRDGDWYEGMFRTLRLSDREVESPCRLETTIRLELGMLLPLPDWPAERGPAPLSRLEAVETEPVGPITAPVRTTLQSGERTPVLFVDIRNWCQTVGIPGLSIMREDVFNPNTYSGLMGPLGSTPPCIDSSRPPTLLVTPAPAP